MMGKTAFYANNHLMHMGKYKGSGLTVREVFEKDPDYMVWVHENLKGIRFQDGLTKRIIKHKNQLNEAKIQNSNEAR